MSNKQSAPARSQRGRHSAFSTSSGSTGLARDGRCALSSRFLNASHASLSIEQYEPGQLKPKFGSLRYSRGSPQSPRSSISGPPGAASMSPSSSRSGVVDEKTVETMRRVESDFASGFVDAGDEIRQRQLLEPGNEWRERVEGTSGATHFHAVSCACCEVFFPQIRGENGWHQPRPVSDAE